VTYDIDFQILPRQYKDEPARPLNIQIKDNLVQQLLFGHIETHDCSASTTKVKVKIMNHT